MTRVLIHAQEFEASARLLRETSTQLSQHASVLARIADIPMPAEVAAVVRSTVDGAHRELLRLASYAEEEGQFLTARANMAFDPGAYDSLLPASILHGAPVTPHGTDFAGSVRAPTGHAESAFFDSGAHESAKAHWQTEAHHVRSGIPVELVASGAGAAVVGEGALRTLRPRFAGSPTGDDAQQRQVATQHLDEIDALLAGGPRPSALFDE